MTPDGLPPLDIDTSEDRYSRLRLIPWWDQEALRRAKVMVVGAGALGNEIIKGLALLGIGSLLIVDFDRVEESNLSRSVLYSSDDEGASKAHAAAAAARRINPDCDVTALDADITHEVGLGLFRWANVIVCGLDNREARLAVNKACWKVNRPWVDGATEGFQGVARVFVPPDGPCYECTLSEQDQRVMAVRDSCGFLAREAYRQGRTPTTPTTSAVIAGVEVQEAVKLLHKEAELPGLAGHGFFFNGMSYDCFTIEYVRRDDCLSHETWEDAVESGLSSDSATLSDVMKLAREHVGKGATIDLPCEMVTGLRCGSCGSSETLFRLLDTMKREHAACPECGSVRVPDVAHECNEESPFRHTVLSELGFAVMDILPARAGERNVYIEISGDRARVFGGDHYA